MNGTHVIGTSVDSYNDSDPHYLYAIRRNDDGDLFLCRLDIADNSDSIQMFMGDVPVEFEDMTYPGEDYHDNRNPTTHELTYEATNVKYEQWRWDHRLISYYINDNGEFVVAINKDIPLKIVEPIIPNDPTEEVVYTLYGEQAQLDCYTWLIEQGWNGISNVVLLNAGNITSNNSNEPAVYIKGNFPNGFTFVNEGNITGSDGFITYMGAYAQPSPGITVLTVCNLYNEGYISGGVSISDTSLRADSISGFNLIDDFANIGEIVGLAP
jgi:hypothetical protein